MVKKNGINLGDYKINVENISKFFQVEINFQLTMLNVVPL